MQIYTPTANIIAGIFLLLNLAISSHAQQQPHVARETNTDTNYTAYTRQLRSDTIPDSVFHMTALRHLSITGMDCDYKPGNGCWAIGEIPEAIRNLKALRSLRLNVNAIQRIPIALAALPHLRELDLTDNVALQSAEHIELLTGLESLYLYGCSLKRLPNNISALRKLRHLGLTGNPISPQERARIRKALPNCSIRF